MRNSLYALIFPGLLLILLPGGMVLADQEKDSDMPIPVASDLSQLATQSSRRKVPILLMFSATDCDYCERLEADVIRPMMLSGDFDRRAIFRKVVIDDTHPLKDFRGGKLDAGVFASQRHIKVTPTLVFVDSNGKELAPKVIGYQTDTFYNAYLDQAIDVSQQLLRQE